MMTTPILGTFKIIAQIGDSYHQFIEQAIGEQMPPVFLEAAMEEWERILRELCGDDLKHTISAARVVFRECKRDFAIRKNNPAKSRHRHLVLVK